jgi:ATP-dependent Clp protease protease subunit
MAEKEKTSEKTERASQHDEKELFDARIILISTPVNAKLSHVVNSKLLAMERANNKDPIYVFINSPGGEVYSGFSIFDTIRFIRPDVVTVVSGLAASMGSIIALAAAKERRFAFPNSKFLIHQPSIQGGIGGAVSDIEIHAKDLIETKDRIIQLYADETGMSTAQIKVALDRDRWMSPQQAKEFGLISKIIESRDDLKF